MDNGDENPRSYSSPSAFGTACASPLRLSSLDDIAMYVPVGMPTLRADSLFTLVVTSVDAAGNMGPPATVTWGADDTAPIVTFPNGFDTTPARSRALTLDTYFVCSKAVCRFECQLERLPSRSSSSSINEGGGGDDATNKVLVPWVPCAWRRERFVATLVPITSVDSMSDGHNAQAAARFLRAKMAAVEVDLIQILASSSYRLDGSVEAAVSDISSSAAVTLSFTLLATAQTDPALDSFQQALASLTQIDPADTYYGRSRSERDASGRLCDCSGCATMATCTSGAGQIYDCPCIAQYA